MVAKSPFMVFQRFISPLRCESIVDDLDLTLPDEDIKGNPLKMVIHHERLESIVYNSFVDIILQIETHYNVTHRATTEIDFIWVPQGNKKEKPICENGTMSTIPNKKGFVRTKERDLTCVLFFSDYCSTPDFDSLYEVYGGKLEFPTWGFGFNPERGTMIVYPSSSNFLNTISDVLVGDLIMAKFHIATTTPYVFNYKLFPGDLKTWFSHLK